jgi:penicillin amidase
MKLTSRTHTFTIAGSKLRARRTTGGVVEIWGDSQHDVQRGLGFFHAHDRQVQMLLVRLIGQGRLCECLKDDDESLAIDIFTRQMGLARAAQEEIERLSPEAREFGQAYTDGINDYLRKHRRPLEFRLVGYRPAPWDLADTLLTINVMGYVGLAQTQQDVEKLLIQSIQQGASVEKLKRLFAPHLEGLSEELVDLIRRVQVVERLIPQLPAALPGIMASNNWAVAPARSITGKALSCHDPHLETNRLPAIWCEAVLHTSENYHAGATMPGVPGVIMGRTRHISAGFTYGFMDMVDYFMEECRDGTYRRDDGWKPFQQRRETIWRKTRDAVEIIIHENEHGTLESDLRQAAPNDGLHLCRAYSAQRGGAGRSLAALADLPAAKTVAEARRILGNVSISCNWVIADREGNIGYQQSGLLPKRKASGLYPVPGWWSEYTWQGLAPAEELACLENPAEGIVVTANDDRNQPGKPMSINLCQGTYRAQRITELLNSKPRHSLDDMQRMQCDLLSTQARRFMAVLRPLIPDSPAGRLLADWNLCYDVSSRGATLFEAFYLALLKEVFGKGLFGVETWQAIVSTTNILGAYFQIFDEALLAGDESWFAGRGRDAVFQAILTDVLSVPESRVAAWGIQRQIVLHNLFFRGKLPRLISRPFGVDYGPFALPGGRATITQGQIFETHGRHSTFAPSYRSVCDLGTDELHTALCGGPSGRLLSNLYANGVAPWLRCEYKRIRCGE